MITVIILNCNTFLKWITTYREKFHFGYFQRVCLMSAITEHIHSCHISVSLSSRKMKAYSSPERSYRRKKENHISKHFPLGIYSIKNQKKQCYLMLLQTQIITKKIQDRLKLKILHCFPTAKGDSQIIGSSRLPLYTKNQNWIYTTSSTYSSTD